ncbi:diguanylate cyclase (GGDEF) domain-containing protein [Klenkia marina]|uniref:Diguanylate cyclase (GGDEF) domain-containing protein n=1 Tax=Klenkia marina TaxID=1960309 RepID=A0A1G4XGJ7_9ACTN|nr:tetratricopeptide repeat-containing diguanylate cyclase [Klenkia marina]SCX40296.1 diguanylate cyclase (GGDEF) domain-containing protein [Klenkia marina]
MDVGPLTSVEQPALPAVVAALDELEADARFESELPRIAPAAVAVARDARLLGREDLACRADLVSADIRRRAGHLADAGRTAREMLQWAEQNDARMVLARAHHLMAAVFNELGDLAQALEHAVHSVDLLDESTPAPVQIDHRKRMADCLGLSRDQGAQELYLEVLALAEQAHDVHRAATILNNSAYCASLAGQHDEALTAIGRLRELSDAHDLPLDLATLDTVGRVLLGLGRWDDAEQALRPGLEPEVLDASVTGDGGADFLLTLAEVQRVRGQHAEAGAALDECIRRCERHGLTSIRTRARRERAALLAAAGDHRGAYEEHVRYAAEALAQQSEQREARARTLQAMYETTEARRQSRRYRELALRDALTGLYNRRHVDERLPALLLRREVDGDPVTVALLDLDHFKQVNDTCSHEVGDAVLQQVARILQAAADAAPTGSFAARMGGEEFLLVLAGLDRDAAADCLEGVRRSVAEHPWVALTQGLPVTVSIGVAADGGAPGAAEVLARADVNLYQAKRTGRDRVVGPGVVGPAQVGTGPAR